MSSYSSSRNLFKSEIRFLTHFFLLCLTTTLPWRNVGKTLRTLNFGTGRRWASCAGYPAEYDKGWDPGPEIELRPSHWKAFSHYFNQHHCCAVTSPSLNHQLISAVVVHTFDFRAIRSQLCNPVVCLACVITDKRLQLLIACLSLHN
jgi:hypothetical protein